MIDTKHPEYDHERPDQSEIPLQSGTNKFCSQKGMTGFGTNRFGYFISCGHILWNRLPSLHTEALNLSGFKKREHSN